VSVSRTTCPSCGAGLKSAAGFNPGQAVRCPKCSTPFTVPEPDFEEVEDEPAPKKKGPPARAARARDDDDDDRPRRRRPRDDDEDDDDDRPKKKKKKKSGYQEYKSSPVRFAILGILLVVLGVLAFLLYQKKMKEKEDNAEAPAPAESGNRQVAPPVRPGPRPNGVGDGAVVFDGAKGNGPSAAAAERGMNGMKQVLLAMHNYHDAKRSLPAAAITAPDGKALLSWRVAILPYLEQDTLYKQFRLNEPWDSPANRPLLAQMPAVYQGTLVGNDNKTSFKVFVGGGALFDLRQGRRLSAVADGTSNTLAVVEAGAPVEWTKPDDIPFDGRTAPRLASPTGGDTILAATADGAVRMLSLTRNGPDTIRRLVHAADGELVEIE
jgi:hypothetical protein